MKCCILFLKKVVLIHFIHFSLTDLLNVPYPYHNRFTKKTENNVNYYSKLLIVHRHSTNSTQANLQHNTHQN